MRKKYFLVFAFVCLLGSNLLQAQDTTVSKAYETKLLMGEPVMYIFESRQNQNSQRQDFTKLFYSGAEAEDGEFPWQVAIKRYRDKESVWCGGIIIDENWILTSAHCFKYRDQGSGLEVTKDETQFYIYSGSVSHKENGHTSKIEGLIIHPNYIVDSLKNDIALLRTKIDLSKEYVEKSNIADQSIIRKAYADSTLTVAVGWGKTMLDDSPEILQKVQYPLIDYAACKQYDTMSSKLKENMLCYGTEGENIACNGDSGSGLFYINETSHALIGLVTTGSDCYSDDSQQEDFTMITSIYPYKKWIMEKIKAYEEEKVTENVAEE